MSDNRKEIQLFHLKMEIEGLKKNLKRTDYQAIKFAEGLITEIDYAAIKSQRQAWRDKINQLQEQLKSLK